MNDIEAIRRLVHDYCDAVCQGETDRWVSLWAPTGEWNIGRGPVRGREAIRAAYETSVGLFEAVNQVVYNGAVDVDEGADVASGRWYMTEFARSKSQRNIFYLAHYDDTYVRHEGSWRFATRTLYWLYQGPPDLSGAFGPPSGYDRYE